MINNASSSPSSQWQRLLKNAGTWQGSFAQFSTVGQLLSEVPTEVELTPTNEGKSMHQEVRRYPPGQSPQVQAFDYSSLNKATLFFEQGAFSQGSIQWAPFSSSFGVELGLIAGQERVRLVALFDKEKSLKPITLIRETLKGERAQDRSAFAPEDLLGRWEGNCTALYADGRPEQHSQCSSVIERGSNGQIHEPTLIVGDVSMLPTMGTVMGQSIDFHAGTTQESRLIMLPDGCYCRCPLVANPRQTPLYVELGWMVSGDMRQRIRRVYDAAGAWQNLVFCTERRAV